MTYTAIWIVAFLLNGTPIAFGVITPGDNCSVELAQHVFDMQKTRVAPNTYQEGIEFWCDSIRARPPT